MESVKERRQKLFDQAKLAQARARKQLPIWTTVARAMTGNRKLRVELTTGPPMTDGKTIFMQIPVELGFEIPHDPALCGKRGEDLVQLCKACDIREELDVVMFHEIAHLSEDTFGGKLAEKDRIKLFEEAIRSLGASARQERVLRERFDKLTPNNVSFYGTAASVHPYMHLLANLLEDIRVNEALNTRRPGTRTMFKARYAKTYQTGFLKRDDATGEVERIEWKNLNEDFQAGVGILAVAGEYHVEGFLSDRVEADVTSPEMIDFIEQFHADAHLGPAATYKHVVPLLSVLRSKGYFQLPEDEEQDEDESTDDPEEETPQSDDSSDESDSAGDQEGDPGDMGGSSPDESDDSDEGGQQDSSSQDDEQEGGDSGPDEPGGDGSSVVGEDSGEDNEHESGSSEREGGEDSSPAGDSLDQDPGGEGDEDGGELRDGGHEDQDGEDPGEGSEAEGAGQDGDDRNLVEEFEKILSQFGGHADELDGDVNREEMKEAFQAALDELGEEVMEGVLDTLDQLMEQALHFDTASKAIEGIHFMEPGDPRFFQPNAPLPDLSDQVLLPALNELRRLFDKNKRTSQKRHLKTGKINTSALGKRAPLGDPRLFQKKQRPGKQDYHVLIGLDISGSTRGRNIKIIREAAYAKCEMLHRLNVSFEVYAHSGDNLGLGRQVLIVPIKEANERWNNETRQRLAGLDAVAANLDGHTLEFYRKRMQRSKATDKIILYYTDGAMPAENYEEELEILQREIDNCKRLGIRLAAVGINSTDPEQYGLQTALLRSTDDVREAVVQLQGMLS